MGMGGQLSFSSMDPSRQQQVAGGNYQNMQGSLWWSLTQKKLLEMIYI